MGNMLKSVDENDLREKLLDKMALVEADLEQMNREAMKKPEEDNRPWYEKYKDKDGTHFMNGKLCTIRKLGGYKPIFDDNSYLPLKPGESFGGEWINRVTLYENVRMLIHEFKEFRLLSTDVPESLVNVIGLYIDPDFDDVVSLMKELVDLAYQFDSDGRTTCPPASLCRIKDVLEDAYPFKLRRISRML